MKSEFQRWFVKQFGALPDQRRRVRLSCQVHDLESVLFHKNKEIEKLADLETRHTAALYAWQVKGKRRRRRNQRIGRRTRCKR